MALNEWQMPSQWARDYCRTRIGVVWEMGEFLNTIAMWLIMMVSMMTPTVLPWVRALQTKESPHRDAQPFQSLTPWFVLGYLAAWSLFSALASVVQWQLASRSILLPAQWIGNHRLYALMLLALGFYQWTPLKDTCLKHCESPVSYFLTHWHDGCAGAMRMGFQHGLYCVGCCWLLMLFMVLVGAMSLFWMAVSLGFILVEMYVPSLRWVSRASGALAIFAGTILLILP